MTSRPRSRRIPPARRTSRAPRRRTRSSGRECRRPRPARRRCVRARPRSRGGAFEKVSYSRRFVNNAAVRDYWDQHIHDLEITRHPVGSPGFFADLDEYHFEKLHHLPRLIDFDGYRDRAVLEVGCGAAVDLARFARGGARATGVDVAASAIELAKTNFAHPGLSGEFRVADG